MINAVLKRKHFYLLEKAYTTLAVRTIPWLAVRGVTPNQVTVSNLIIGLVILGCISRQYYLAAAILIQGYLFLDVLDGNLARYREMSSRLGAVLDNLGDRFFYNAVMIAIGIVAGNAWWWILFFLISHNLHAAIATYYIVPRIRKMASFRRFALKQWLMDRGYILGMDLSTQDLLMSVLLVTPWRIWIVPFAGGLYLLDLLFRLIELRRNR